MAAYILYHTWKVRLQSLNLETFGTTGVRKELCNEMERFMKSLSVGEGLQLGPGREKLPVFVSWRHFRTSGIMRTWNETERGTYKRQKTA